MSTKIKDILSIILILGVCVSVLLLLVYILGWLINLISASVLDKICGGLILLFVGFSVLEKTAVEIRSTGRVSVCRWIGLLLAAALFIWFCQFVDTLDTQEQSGCGFGMFFLVLLMLAPLFPPPRIEGDDEDDYHASR